MAILPALTCSECQAGTPAKYVVGIPGAYASFAEWLLITALALAPEGTMTAQQYREIDTVHVGLVNVEC